jgi:hypothetical protein
VVLILERMKFTLLRRMLLALAVLVVMLAISHVSLAQRPVGLFFIERNKNANIVVYEANLAQDGLFDTKNPVNAYWLMKAEKGQREELNKIEREMAYGFSARVVDDRKSAWLTLVAYKAQPIHLIVGDGGVRPEAQIAGRKSHLTKIYVKASDALIPSVEYIELHGIDVSTGKPLVERRKP